MCLPIDHRFYLFLSFKLDPTLPTMLHQFQNGSIQMTSEFEWSYCRGRSSRESRQSCQYKTYCVSNISDVASSPLSDVRLWTIVTTLLEPIFDTSEEQVLIIQENSVNRHGFYLAELAILGVTHIQEWFGQSIRGNQLTAAKVQNRRLVAGNVGSLNISTPRSVESVASYS